MLLGILRVSSPRLRRPQVETRPPEPLRDSGRLDAATDQNRATRRQPLPPCWSPVRATPAPPSPARLSAPGSIAPCDIIVLLFATQIKHKSGTPIHDGPLKAEVTFCVQGVLSPLLANLVLDELDRELEHRGHRFVRYADDCNIYVRSERAGQRVMESITRFITQKLKLKVNEAKSAVARPQERKFLGFSFTAGPEVKRTIAPKALDRFKQRIREITRRAKGVSMKTTMEESLLLFLPIFNVGMIAGLWIQRTAWFYTGRFLTTSLMN